MDFTPDIYVRAYSSVTAEMLKKLEISGVLTDLDDTLVTHGNMEVNDNVKKWVMEMKENKIAVCIISNNNTKRVRPFAEKLGVPYVCNAFKPNIGFIAKAERLLDIDRSRLAFMGDQLFTDIKAAKKGGLKSILVDPVGTKTIWWVRLKRIKENKLRKQFKRYD